jgi:hypothetical protein
MEHADTAFKQSSLLLKGGRGCEHQFPHLYSQVGDGVSVIVFVQSEAVVVVVVVVVVGEVVVVVVVGEVVVVVVVEELVVVEVVVVVVVVVVDEVVLEDVVVVVEVVVVEVNPHGSLDPKSVATYKSSAPAPPQVSEEFPVHAISQVLEEIGAVPLPRTTPQ